MSRVPSPEEVVRRAQLAHDARIESVRALAVARQSVSDAADAGVERLAAVQREVSEAVDAAELDDAKAYAAALGAGWTADELRRIGLAEPAKKKRVAQRRRTTAQRATGTAPQTPEPSAQDQGTADN